MNIHIIQDQDDNSIIAVFGSRLLSPASLEREVIKAMDEAMEMETNDCFTAAEEILAKQDIVCLHSGGTQTWEYTLSWH